jgi:dihydroorotate dehydrogenase electron transfer subunit
MPEEKLNQAPERVYRRGQFIARIVDQTGQGCYRRLILELKDAAARCLANAKAGQFIQIACRDLQEHRQSTPLLRRPFSLSRVTAEISDVCDKSTPPGDDPQRLYLEILYRLLGPGTNWLAQCKIDREIDILGPLGNGFTPPPRKNQKCLLVGGGVGLPPLFFLADQLRYSGSDEIVAIAGERTRDRFVATFDTDRYDESSLLSPQLVIREFARNATPCIITTDDGSFGFAGHVVAALEGFLDQNPLWRSAVIYACGPTIMMKETAKLAQSLGMPCQVCMEANMSCGIGLCQSCAVPVRSSRIAQSSSPREYKLVCSNGPVFDATKIDWDLL